MSDDKLVERRAMYDGVTSLLNDWQTARREWHGPTTLEVVREYAEWREAALQSEHASMEGEIERLPDDEAASLRIIQKAFQDAGVARPFFGEAYEPGTVIASIVRQVAALTSSKTGYER